MFKTSTPHIRKPVLRPVRYILLLLLTLISSISYAQYKQRVYANTQTNSVEAAGNVQLLGAVNLSLAQALQQLGIDLADLGTVTNPDNAIDVAPATAPRTFSRLSATYLDVNLNVIVPVARVRVGARVSQNLKFPSVVAGNAPVTLKLGFGGGVAQTLLDGLNIQATLNGVPVGPVVTKTNNILGLLGNRSVVELTFTPGVPYDGVRVLLNSEGLLASLNAFQSVDVYDAYYLADVPSLANCDAPFDALFGANASVSALGSVTDPYNAIDNDPNTFATLNSGASVLPTPDQGVYHTSVFPTYSRAGDSVKAVISFPGTLLEAQLLSSISFQTLNKGDDGVESVVQTFTGSTLLSLELLSGTTDRATVSFRTTQPFNRIRVLYGGAVVALQSVRLYDVRRVAANPIVEVPGLDPATNTLIVCQGTPVELRITNPEAGSSYQWYTTPTGGSPVTTGVSANGTVFSPTGLALGNNVFYVSLIRNGCGNEASARTRVTITVNPAPAAADIQIAGNSAPFCAGSPVVLTPSVVASPSVAIPAPLFRWYRNADRTGLITDGLTENGVTYAIAANGTLTVTGLTANATYYVSVAANNGAGCESATLQSVPVTVNFIPPPEAITLSSNIVQCTGTPVVLAPTAIPAITNPVFTWYRDAAKTQPILDGTSDGAVTYAIAANGTLTVNGLAANADVNYYVTVRGDNACESAAGKQINVKVSAALPAPAFVASTVDVCGPGQTASFEISNNAGGFTYTIYDALTGGNPVTTGFTITGNTISFANVTASATYFVEVTGAGGCAGVARSEIRVNVSPLAPAGAIASLNVNNSTGGNVCATADGRIVLTATSTGITNPTYYFYEGSTLRGSNQTGVFEVTPFTPGVALTYSVGISGTGLCETAAADRTSITFTPNLLPGNPTLNLSGVQVITAGSSVQLTVDPQPAGAVSYQWFKGTTQLAETSATLTLTNVTAADAGVYRVVAVGAGGCTSAADATVTIQIADAAFWESYVVAGGGTTVRGGEEVTWTLHLRNNGSQPISNYVLSDMVPANTTLRSITDGGTESAGRITWAPVTVNPGETVTRSFTVLVNADLTGVPAITNVGYVSDGVNPERPSIPASPTDPNQPGDPTKQGSSVPVQAVNTTVSWKSFAIPGGATTVRGGEEVTYTVKIRNTGNQALSNVIVRDDIPANTTFVRVADNGIQNGNQVVWSGVSVPVGQTVSLSFVVGVNADLTGVTSINNVAVVNDGVNPEQPTLPPDPANPDEPGDPTTPGTNIPVQQVNQTVTWKKFSIPGGATTVAGGEDITYTIKVRNTGNQTLGQVRVSDAVPENTTVVSVANGGVQSGNTINWTGVNVPVGQTVDLSFVVRVNTNLTGVSTIRNVAVTNDGINPDQQSIPPDSANPDEPGDPTKTGTDIPVRQVTQTVSWKSFSIPGGATTVRGGEEVTYTIRMRNTGNQALSNVAVRDEIPANTTFVSAGDNGSLNSGQVTWSGISIPVGGTVSVSFVVRVNTDLTGVGLIRNVAYVNDGTGPEQPTAPPDPSNPAQPGNPATPGTDIPVQTVNSTVGWKAFSIAGGATSVKGGEQVTYTIKVRNTGNQILDNVTVRDDIPANTTFVSVANGGTRNGNQLTWTGLNIPVGGTASLNFVVNVNTDLTGINVIRNIAVVNDGINPDQPTIPPSPGNPDEPGNPATPGTDIPVDQATSTVSWKAFSIPGGATSVRGGEQITYTIRVRNTGNQALTNVTVRDDIPAKTTFVSVADNGTITGNTLTWSNLSVPVGQTISLSFVVRVDADLTGVTTIRNVAVVNDSVNPEQPTLPPNPTDPTEPGNPGTPGTDIPVETIGNFTTSMTVVTPRPSGIGRAGDELTYTITVTNTGNQVLTNAAITDALPNKTTFVSASNGGTLNGTNVQYTIPTLGVGQSQTVQLVVRVNNDLAGVTSIRNSATVSAGGVTKNTDPVDVTIECVAPSAPAQITTTGNSICPGTGVTLAVVNPDSQVIYRWYTTQLGGTPVFEGPSFATGNLNSSVTYWVEATRIAGQCTSPTRTSITINVLTQLATPAPTVLSTTPTSVTFGWQAIPGASGYEVSIDNGGTWTVPSAGAAATSHVIAGLKPDQMVTIRVRATGAASCQTSTASPQISGTSSNPMGNEVFVPNAFTPNGDGKNDVFLAFGNTITSIDMRVYNQWGQLIFRSQNLQQGWDGTFEGKMQPTGVYVYAVELKFKDGTDGMKKGTVTLLR
ncbi:gliding motility-associated C-terminal domain-containing protein [Pedobacter sp. SYP-B3415]|uniref:Ig-like domain-containing protein n=1 Tax=Pedobacter sp. SYP-B3415 TaxID=2496641 RepID=UPI00101C74E5|nr:gliding motility-associated C-terminal domain-containing protein [Pedobacter sp. SYP-B3415]